MPVRPATDDDIPAMVTLIEAHRELLQQLQNQLGRKSAGSAEMTKAWFGFLLSDDMKHGFVHESAGEIDGFIIAALLKAPPVYDPDGLACIIDDFAVASDDLWPTVGVELLAYAKAWAKDNGGTLTAVLTPHQYAPKVDALKAAGHTVAASLWVGDN